MHASLLGSLELTSGWGVVLSIFVLGGLFILWLWSVFLLVTDSISWIAKIVWFILLVCLAPLAIPAYLIFHHHRTGQA